MIETINEAIEVVSVFTDGKMQPLRFKWKGNVVKVKRITGGWIKNEGEAKVYYYSILGENSDYFEICYDSRTLRWTLCRVFLEG
ncbi:MAG: hypothetical protein JSW03_10705 [Candidatus Eiseniibacteriota bacterium]|nr:MAG: hypothetical protein JSW03_10705 [Candidatus Eisenbacteria bacterium]